MTAIFGSPPPPLPSNLIYLDHAATTPVRPEVAEAYARALLDFPANPSSPHAAGRAARKGIEDARDRIAAAIGTQPKEIVFTSGGTESDNLALFGLARVRPGSHVVATRIEHAAILESCKALEQEGHSVTLLNVDAAGRVPPGSIAAAIRPETAVVSVMHGNNEVGTLQPIPAIAAACRERNVPLHVDAVQSGRNARIDVTALGCDLLSLSAHKMNGPRGVGLLYVRKGIRLAPLLHGGAHESGRRAGTENLAGIVAFAEAVALAQTPETLDAEAKRLAPLRDTLQKRLLAEIPGAVVHAAAADRLPHILNVSFEGTRADAMVIALDQAGICVTAGSACHTGDPEPSHVLAAMGVPAPLARAAIRFSFGLGSSAADVDAAARAVAEAVTRLRTATAGA